MPQPEGAALNFGLSPMLTMIGSGLAQTMSNEYIAKKIFPNVPVGVPTGQYPVWNRGDFLRRQSKRLSNYEAPPIIGFATGKASYSVDRYGISTNWTSMDIANARAGGMTQQAFENGKVKLVTETNLIELEIQTANLIMTPGNWSTTRAGVTSGPSAGQFIQWDQTASDPVQDVLAWKKAIRMAYGVNVNKMILGHDVLDLLAKNISMIDKIKYGGTMDRPTEVTLAQIKALFKIDDIEVPESVYNTTGEGETAAYSYIWNPKSIWMGYVTSAPSMTEASAGYHFSWTGNTSAGLPAGIAGGEGPQNFGSYENPDGLFIFEYAQNRPRAHFIDCELFTTPGVSAPDMGFTATAVVA